MFTWGPAAFSGKMIDSECWTSCLKPQSPSCLSQRSGDAAGALQKPPDSGDTGGDGRKGACQSRFPPGGGASLRARPGHQNCCPRLGAGSAASGLRRALAWRSTSYWHYLGGEWQGQRPRGAARQLQGVQLMCTKGSGFLLPWGLPGWPYSPSPAVLRELGHPGPGIRIFLSLRCSEHSPYPECEQ